MFGIMAVLLESGDAFRLVPRAFALCTTGLENFTVQLGLGKWITSVTMTIFMLFFTIASVNVIRHDVNYSGDLCTRRIKNYSVYDATE